MPVEGLKVVIGYDVNSALQGSQKLTRSLQDVEKQLADTLSAGEDFAKGLDDIVKEGNIAGGIINFLQKEINDFKKAFASATTTEDIQKFGAALQILQDKQNQVIQSSLKAGDSIEQVGKHSGSGVVATQRLSSSLLGLSRDFSLLPPELTTLTHGFDQIFQAYERVGHGSETTGEKIGKFAGVLGQAGLGIAIGLAIGLLADFVKELFSTKEAAEEVTQAGSELALSIDKINKSVSESNNSISFIRDLSDTFADIKLGDGFESNLTKLQLQLGSLKEQSKTLGDAFTDLDSRFEGAFARMLGNVTEKTDGIIRQFGTLSNIPESVVKDLPDVDKGLIENAKKAFEARAKAQEDFNKNLEQQLAKEAAIKQLRADEDRANQKVANDALQKLLQSRESILEEFRIKFGSIKLPLPLFDSEVKAIPLGKLNDKLLREFLQGTFSVFEKEAKKTFGDLFGNHAIEVGDIPIDIHLKPEIVGTSDLVRKIEDKLGEISKQVADNVNKGLFEVPIEFTTPPEGDGKALKEFEDRRDKLASEIEGLTGQKKVKLDFNFDITKLDPANAEKVLNDVEDIMNRKSRETPIKVKIGANFKVVPLVDTEQLQKNLDAAISDAVDAFLFDTLNNIGDTIGTAIGDVLSGQDISNAFKGLLTTLADALGQLGKSLIKAGIIATGIGKAISALGKGNPALAIGLGVALLALSQALKNNLSQQRASGGTVFGDKPYLVNEQGQEAFMSHGKVQMIEGGKQFFTPPSSGKILPAWLAKQYAAKLNLPALEGGGAITGPTFALIGEGFGISASNPEIVAPSAWLKGLLSGNSSRQDTTESLIRGKDLVLLHNRQTRSNVRNV